MNSMRRSKTRTNNLSTLPSAPLQIAHSTKTENSPSVLFRNTAPSYFAVVPATKPAMHQQAQQGKKVSAHCALGNGINHDIFVKTIVLICELETYSSFQCEIRVEGAPPALEKESSRGAFFQYFSADHFLLPPSSDVLPLRRL